MKKYLFLLFAVLLLGSCTKNLQIGTLKQPVYATQTVKYPLISVAQANQKTATLPVVQPLPTAKMSFSSQNLYEQAYYEIRQMLQGGKPLSFKKAVYLTENAYFDNELPENSFNQAITDLVELTKVVEKTCQMNYKYGDSLSLRKNYAIYRVLADTLNIANVFQLLPYEYDFEDSRGEKEWAKGFVTKLLATRTGNCHSLPFLYKILAEELGTEAYLSLLPHHIYLQIPYQRPPYGSLTYFNTELTSKTFPIDAWVMTAAYVSMPAIQTGMYMDRLDNKQSIALCLVDLAKGFETSNKDKLSAREIDEFMQNCVNLALQTAPNLITAKLLQVELDKRAFERTKSKLIYKQLETLVTQLFADGYLELPELMYSEKPRTVGLDSTYTPFYEENQREGNPAGYAKKVLTLSNGRYDEFLRAKKIETVGSVRFDTERKRIVGFGENKRQVEVVSRFLSVDPITKEYPELTPYQFASNRPIDGIDLDGLEYVKSSAITKAELSKLGLSNEKDIKITSFKGIEYINLGFHVYREKDGTLSKKSNATNNKISEWVYIYKDLTVKEPPSTSPHIFVWKDGTVTGSTKTSTGKDLPNNENCNYLATSQAEETGATPTKNGLLQTHKINSDNTVTLYPENISKAEDYINRELDAGRAVVVAVDYKEGNHSGQGDGTDHFITIVGRYEAQDGTKLFFFADNGGNSLTSLNRDLNVLQITNTKIKGTSAMGGGKDYTVTQVRPNTQNPKID